MPSITVALDAADTSFSEAESRWDFRFRQFVSLDLAADPPY